MKYQCSGEKKDVVTGTGTLLERNVNCELWADLPSSSQLALPPGQGDEPEEIIVRCLKGVPFANHENP